jgi:uncharacterized protein (DUF1778 family)
MPQPKAKRVGRPKLPKGHAKGRVFGIRLTDDDIKKLTAAAKTRKQTLTEFIRGPLSAAMEV